MCTNDFICFYDWAECRLIRRIDVNVKVSNLASRMDIHNVLLFPSVLYHWSFFLCLLQNVYWADSGDLVTIASDSSFYILKYNVS
jgi:coatomer subunit beta'